MFLVTLDEKAAAEVAYKWILEPRAEVRHRLRQDRARGDAQVKVELTNDMPVPRVMYIFGTIGACCPLSSGPIAPALTLSR